MPVVKGRGAGLGNEIIPWARSHVAANLLGARSLSPAFGLNQRGYSNYFGTFKGDWIVHRTLAALLPRYHFGENELQKFGGGDLETAVLNFSAHLRLDKKASWVLTTDGMWGGYNHIAPAKDFVRSVLYLTKSTAKNLASIDRRIDKNKILVGMHVRLGDFGSELKPEEYKGKFNSSLPLSWYLSVQRKLVDYFSQSVQFLIVTDGTKDAVRDLLSMPGTISTTDIPDSDISDVLSLARCDLLVCSVSSYSSLAAFLSDAPYIWFQPNLQQIDGFYSIWGHEKSQKLPESSTSLSMRWARQHQINLVQLRGIPVGTDAAIPKSILGEVWRRKNFYPKELDLLHYGVVPIE